MPYVLLWPLAADDNFSITTALRQTAITQDGRVAKSNLWVGNHTLDTRDAADWCRFARRAWEMVQKRSWRPGRRVPKL